MSLELLAFAAAVCGLLAAWEALGELERLAGRIGGALAPLRLDDEPDAVERRRLVLTALCGALAGGWVAAGPVVAVALAALAPAAVGLGLRARAGRRRARLVADAAAVARAIAAALSSGRSIRRAAGDAHLELSGPARRELAGVARALAVGATTEAALERLRSTASHPSYDAIVAAVLLQREAGGDLAGLLRRLAAALERQARAEADARAVTAQARFAAKLVAALPFVAAALAEVVAPGSLAALVRTPISAALVGCSIALQLAAAVVIRRVARVGA